MAFDPGAATADEVLEEIKGEAATAAAQDWGALRDLIAGDLRLIADTTLETAKARALGELTDAEVDSILSAREHLLNITLITAKAVPYIVAQDVLKAVFKVVGLVVAAHAGINPFP